MKHFILIATTLLLNVLEGYAFKSNGVYYGILWDNPDCVTVAGSDPEEHIVIPPTVIHEGVTYKVTQIQSEAFKDCGNLISVKLPEGLERIGADAFHQCWRLKELNLPKSVTYLEGSRSPFELCHKLPVEIENGLRYMFDGAVMSGAEYDYFAEPPTKFNIKEGVRFIVANAFSSWYTDSNHYNYLHKVEEVTIPEGVIQIGEYAFTSCYSNLTSIKLPESLLYIGKYAFYECINLTDINIPKGVIDIGEGAFKYTNITHASIPPGVTEIKKETFICKNLESIEISEGVKKIGQAGIWASKLKELTLPSSLQSITLQSIQAPITKITIPEHLQFYEAGVNFTCPQLHSVRCVQTVPLHRREGSTYVVKIFPEVCYKQCILYVPCGTRDLYADSHYYRFFQRIREEMTAPLQTKHTETYTLMMSKSMGYLVHDGGKLVEVESNLHVDEANPHHNWMILHEEGKCYLYNLGAKKYLAEEEGTLVLCNDPKPLKVTIGKQGMILGGNPLEWSLVRNYSMQPDEHAWDKVTGIANTLQDASSSAPLFDLQGRRLQQKPAKGLYIQGGRKVLGK